jgi:hypothetical protein
MAGDWTDAQNDAIVADYFAMLADDIAGRPYSKAGRRDQPAGRMAATIVWCIALPGTRNGRRLT